MRQIEVCHGKDRTTLRDQRRLLADWPTELGTLCKFRVDYSLVALHNGLAGDPARRSGDRVPPPVGLSYFVAGSGILARIKDRNCSLGLPPARRTFATIAHASGYCPRQ